MQEIGKLKVIARRIVPNEFWKWYICLWFFELVHETTLKLGPSDQNERNEFSSNQSQTYKHTTYNPRLSLLCFPLVVEELSLKRRQRRESLGSKLNPDKSSRAWQKFYVSLDWYEWRVLIGLEYFLTLHWLVILVNWILFCFRRLLLSGNSLSFS